MENTFTLFKRSLYLIHIMAINLSIEKYIHERVSDLSNLPFKIYIRWLHLLDTLNMGSGFVKSHHDITI